MTRFITGILFALTVAAQQAAPQVAVDSLAVIPAHPTTLSPIVFDIVIRNWDCCTEYYSDSTAAMVADTEILLSYQYQHPQICSMVACPVGTTMTLPFKSSPLAAGTYAVYESRQAYCAGGTICPGPVFAPVKIGSVTVVTPTRTLGTPRTGARIASFAGDNVRIYNVKGEVVGRTGPGGSLAGRESVQAPGVYYTGSRGAVAAALVR